MGDLLAICGMIKYLKSIWEDTMTYLVPFFDAVCIAQRFLGCVGTFLVVVYRRDP